MFLKYSKIKKMFVPYGQPFIRKTFPLSIPWKGIPTDIPDANIAWRNS